MRKVDLIKKDARKQEMKYYKDEVKKATTIALGTAGALAIFAIGLVIVNRIERGN